MSYSRIFGQLASINFAQQTAYPLSFILAMVGKLLRLGLAFLFAFSVFQFVPEIAGWRREEVYLLMATIFTIEHLAGVTFHRNFLFFLARYVRQGEYDAFLVKPAPLLFLTGLWKLDFFDTLTVIPILGFLAYLIDHYDPTIINIGLYLAALAVGILIFLALTLMLSSINFRTIITTGSGRLLEALLRTNRLPYDVLPDGLRWFFLSFIPLGTVAYVPMQFLRGLYQPITLLWFTFLMLVFLWGSIILWFRQLRHYSSVSG